MLSSNGCCRDDSIHFFLIIIIFLFLFYIKILKPKYLSEGTDIAFAISKKNKIFLKKLKKSLTRINKCRIFVV